MTLDRRSLLTASTAGAGALALGISLPEQAEAATRSRTSSLAVEAGIQT